MLHFLPMIWELFIRREIRFSINDDCREIILKKLNNDALENLILAKVEINACRDLLFQRGSIAECWSCDNTNIVYDEFGRWMEVVAHNCRCPGLPTPPIEVFRARRMREHRIALGLEEDDVW